MVVSCDSLSTKSNTVIRHDSLDIDITWQGAEIGPDQYLWNVLSISADSPILCHFTSLSSTVHPNHILPDTLKVAGLPANRNISVDLNKLKNSASNILTEPSSTPQSPTDTSITYQTIYFDYILFGVQVQ